MSGLRLSDGPLSGPVVPTGRTGWDWSPADVRATMSRTAGARLTRRRERHARSLLVGADLVAVLIGVFLGRAADPTAPATVLALTVVPARLLALAWRGAYDGVGGAGTRHSPRGPDRARDQ